MTAPIKRPKEAFSVRTEDGDTLLSGTFERCANEIIKRCRALAKGALGYGSGQSRFAWSIVGPNGETRTRHSITVLS